MALSGIGIILTPILWSIWLKFYWDFTFTLFALLDLIISIIIFLLWLKLKEVNQPIFNTKTLKQNSIKNFFKKNYTIAKIALKNIFQNPKMISILFYRTFGTQTMFLTIISLPFLTEKGIDWRISGLIVALWGIMVIRGNKIAHKIAEKTHYNKLRIRCSCLQAIALFICGFTLNNIYLFIIILIIFYWIDGVRMVTRNQILVSQTKGIAIATTRSIIIWIVSLYLAVTNQIASWFELKYALLFLGSIIIITNFFLIKKIKKL